MGLHARPCFSLRNAQRQSPCARCANPRVLALPPNSAGPVARRSGKLLGASWQEADTLRAMNARPLLLVTTLLCSLAFASCTQTFHAHASKGALAKREPVSIFVHDDDSGEEECLVAIHNALHARGFPVARGKSSKLEVKMSDTWRWDWSMYLKKLDIEFIDTKTGQQKAHAHYHNSLWHKYPSRTWVVQKLFHELDQQGVFQK